VPVRALPVIFTLVQPGKSTRTSGTRHLADRTRRVFGCMVKRHMSTRRPRTPAALGFETDGKWMNRVEVSQAIALFPAPAARADDPDRARV
jgi:hypothetical protein